MITQENFDKEYVDMIERQQIDKFVCAEMGRQIHRYIKAMAGTKTMMERFEEQLAHLTVPQKEEAIARYIDLNRQGTGWTGPEGSAGARSGQLL